MGRLRRRGWLAGQTLPLTFRDLHRLASIASDDATLFRRACYGGATVIDRAHLQPHASGLLLACSPNPTHQHDPTLPVIWTAAPPSSYRYNSPEKPEPLP